MNECALKIRMVMAVVGPFLGILLAIVLSWQKYVFGSDMLLLAVMYILTAFGATMGYHRMLTHRGFQAPSWFRGLLLILGCMAFAGSKPDEWAATHIRHHAYSDEEGDPHSPRDGFWHAHFGWLFSQKNYATAEECAPHLLQDPVVMFVSRWSLLWMMLAFLIPFTLGGWTGLLWGGVVRLFLTTHVTWSVNSVCHTFGKRPFATTDESRNHWIVGLLGLGEGWHNNHHAFPQSAFHGLHWWQIDLTGILICTLEWVGLVWNVERVSKEMRTNMQSRLTRAANLQQSMFSARKRVLAS